MADGRGWGNGDPWCEWGDGGGGEWGMAPDSYVTAPWIYIVSILTTILYIKTNKYLNDQITLKYKLRQTHTLCSLHNHHTLFPLGDISSLGNIFIEGKNDIDKHQGELVYRLCLLSDFWCEFYGLLENRDITLGTLQTGK